LQHGSNALICPVGEVDAIAASLADLAQNRGRITPLSREAFQTARAYLKELSYAQNLRDYLESFQSISAT
jgi:hypothetical protein